VSPAAEGIAAIGLFLISFIARALTGYALPYQSVWDEVVTYPGTGASFREDDS
jgi:hypothetical protein